MKKSLLRIALTVTVLATIAVACRKQSNIEPKDDPSQGRKFKTITLITGITPEQCGPVHNTILDPYAVKHGMSTELMTRSNYMQMVEDLAVEAKLEYGNPSYTFMKSEGATLMDRLGGFQNEILNVELAVNNIINLERDPEFKRVMTKLITSHSTADISLVDIARGEFTNPNSPEAIAFMSVMTSSLVSAKKREGIGGILQTPQYPLASHNDKVELADCMGWRFGYSSSIGDGKDKSVAYYNAARMASIMSAARDRELRRAGQ